METIRPTGVHTPLCTSESGIKTCGGNVRVRNKHQQYPGLFVTYIHNGKKYSKPHLCISIGAWRGRWECPSQAPTVISHFGLLVGSGRPLVGNYWLQVGGSPVPGSHQKNYVGKKSIWNFFARVTLENGSFGIFFELLWILQDPIFCHCLHDEKDDAATLWEFP